MKMPPLIPSDDEYPPLEYWRLDFCYEVIQQLLQDVVFTWRNESCAYIHEPSYRGPYAEDVWLDEHYWLGFKNMACSQVAVGALASLIETLFHRAARRFREVFHEAKPKLPHHRWMLSEKDFWNPSKRRKEEDGSTVPNIVDGFRQLVRALGYDESLLHSSWEIIDALFRYRNASLHNGYVWPTERSDTLAKGIKERKWGKWFYVGKPDVSNKDTEPWPIWMTDEFVQVVLKEVPTIALALRNICTSLSDRARPPE